MVFNKDGIEQLAMTLNRTQMEKEKNRQKRKEKQQQKLKKKQDMGDTGLETCSQRVSK